jgi:hypothetical protein
MMERRLRRLMTRTMVGKKTMTKKTTFLHGNWRKNGDNQRWCLFLWNTLVASLSPGLFTSHALIITCSVRYRDYIWLHVRECNVIICSTEMRLV